MTEITLYDGRIHYFKCLVCWTRVLTATGVLCKSGGTLTNTCVFLLRSGPWASWSCWAKSAGTRCSVCPRLKRTRGWTRTTSAEAPATWGDSSQWKLNRHDTIGDNCCVSTSERHTSYTAFFLLVPENWRMHSLPPVKLKELLGPKAEKELADW